MTTSTATTTRRGTRALVLGTAFALLLVFLPVEPVVAEPAAPATRSETVDGVTERLADVAGPGEAASALTGPPVTGQGRHPQDGGENGDEEADGGARRTDPIEAPLPFVGLGVQGTGDEPELRWRTRDLDGEWSDWSEAALLDRFEGPDADTAEAARAARHQDEGTWSTDAIWAGESTHVQLEVIGEPDEIEITFTDTAGLSETRLERVGRWMRSLTTARPVEAAEVAGAPDIRTRKEWGANESWRSGSPTYREVNFAVLHHTATTNDYECGAEAEQQIRNIYHWHTQGNGWSDIGYNFLVDRCGNLFEGRYGGMDKGVQGAHVRGWNDGSFGVSALGDFNDRIPDDRMLASISELMAWKYHVHGLNPDPGATVRKNGYSIRTMESHRNLRDGYVKGSEDWSFQRDCPGQRLYWQTPTIRDGIASHFDYLDTGEAVPVRGDWDGDGRDTGGWFRDGVWYLREENSTGAASVRFAYGTADDVPIVGDWDGDGRDTVGVIRDGTWHLRNALSGGESEISFHYGRISQGDVPLVGDWNADGADTIGIVRDGTWHLRYELAGGRGDETFVYGRVLEGDVPLVGDWDADGEDTIGIVREGEWHLRNERAGGPSDHMFVYGRVLAGDVPLIGDWDAGGTDTPAIARADAMHLRLRNAGGSADISLRIAALDP